MCRILNICCCFLQAGPLEIIKTNIKIQHVQIDELPRTKGPRSDKLSLISGASQHPTSDFLTASKFRSQTLNRLLAPMSPISEGGRHILISYSY